MGDVNMELPRRVLKATIGPEERLEIAMAWQ
jgi:hypothetical protein